MLKTLPLILMAFLLSACVPIAPTPPAQSVCHQHFTSIPVNQSAPDPISPDLPGHIDITKVETRLDGQTLTATFHLRDIPALMDVQPARTLLTINYLYTVSVNPDGTEIYGKNMSEYTVVAYHLPETSDSVPDTSEFKLRTVLWRNHIDKDIAIIKHEELPNHVDLQISHQSNTLTMTVDVPDISENATVLFVTKDFLAGSDGNSCKPSP